MSIRGHIALLTAQSLSGRPRSTSLNRGLTAVLCLYKWPQNPLSSFLGLLLSKLPFLALNWYYYLSIPLQLEADAEAATTKIALPRPTRGVSAFPWTIEHSSRGLVPQYSTRCIGLLVMISYSRFWLVPHHTSSELYGVTLGTSRHIVTI